MTRLDVRLVAVSNALTANRVTSHTYCLCGGSTEVKSNH